MISVLSYMLLCVCVCVCVQLCLTLCNLMNCSLPASSVHGIWQARILEWVAISFSTYMLTAAAAKSLQSCPTLCDPVPGILQARTLEWVAISFSNAWKWKLKVKSPSHVWFFETPWTAAYQAPLSMGFSRQEYLCIHKNQKPKGQTVKGVTSEKVDFGKTCIISFMDFDFF